MITMKHVKAVFKKQVKDIMKNMGVIVQFVIFPVVAYIMTVLVARSDFFTAEEVIEGAAAFGVNDTMFVTMFSAIFVGMALIPVAAGIIAEDKERKSLRFLVMAGVKPSSYLLGIGGVIFALSLLPSLAFGLMARFQGAELWLFMAAMMSGVIASSLLGLSIGIFSNNQQAATGLALPAALILGFGPMIGIFNESVKKFFSIFYTQQLDTLINIFTSANGYQEETNLLSAFGIIWANIAVLIAVFIIAYTKKGLKG